MTCSGNDILFKNHPYSSVQTPNGSSAIHLSVLVPKVSVHKRGIQQMFVKGMDE